MMVVIAMIPTMVTHKDTIYDGSYINDTNHGNP